MRHVAAARPAHDQPPNHGDHIDRVVQQWNAERPDVDPSPIRIIARINRLSQTIDQSLKSVFNEHGLDAWEYDVLAALRRNGPPFELTAGEILAAVMITSGAVTNRIDRLEQRGFVRRTRSSDDKRVVRVRLTPTGRAITDRTLPAHLRNEAALIAGLSSEDTRQLERLLRKLESSIAAHLSGGDPVRE
jgi:DNA-binding MarR family transcriptional regulator